MDTSAEGLPTRLHASVTLCPGYPDYIFYLLMLWLKVEAEIRSHTFNMCFIKLSLNDRRNCTNYRNSCARRHSNLSEPRGSGVEFRRCCFGQGRPFSP